MKLNLLLLTLVSFVLTACGGGGGGGGGTTPPTGGVVFGCTDLSATNYNPSATTDDGSCSYSGGGGSTSNFYGYNLSTSNEITNKAESALSATAMKVANTLAVDTDSTKVQTNNVDVLVASPSCNDGTNNDYTPRYFNMVLISSSGQSSSNATSVTLELHPTLAKVHTFLNDNISAGNWRMLATTVSSNASVSCSGGKYQVGGFGEGYANSQVAVFKIGNDVYLGLTQGSTFNGSGNTGAAIVADSQSSGETMGLAFEEQGGYGWRSGTYLTPVAANNGNLALNWSSMSANPYAIYGSSGTCSGKAMSTLPLDFTYSGDASATTVCLANSTANGAYKNILTSNDLPAYGALSVVGGKKVGVWAGSQWATGTPDQVLNGSDAWMIIIEK